MNLQYAVYFSLPAVKQDEVFKMKLYISKFLPCRFARVAPVWLLLGRRLGPVHLQLSSAANAGRSVGRGPERRPDERLTVAPDR